MKYKFKLDMEGWDTENNCNVLPIKTHSLRYHEFCYVDTAEYMADKLFADEGVAVKYGDGYFVKPGSPYIIVFCKCRKSDTGKFLSALRKLPSKALLLGCQDYLDVCKDIFRVQDEYAYCREGI